jgi:tetratricopeptide (TPR) repeat protein
MAIAKKPFEKISKSELFHKIRKADISEIAHKLKECRRDGSKRADEARFAVFLGAGASVGAGIKTAGQMMVDFREKVLARDCPAITDKKIQTKWLKDNVLSKGKGNEYSKLFECFERTPKGRQGYVSKLIKDREPTFGYAMLASLIARGFINTTLTTNFDDLAFISCTKFSGVRPVIYAYGIMATEMKFSSPHPKILKMHGDYLYSALANTENEMKRFNRDPNMEAQVTNALNEYELIVFGYGGNDESIMKILANYPPGKEFYWCYRKEEIPNNQVLRLIDEKNGSLVQIEGFDDAMYEIYKIVDFDLDGVLAAYEDRRTEILRYIDEFNKKYPTNVVKEAIEEAKQGVKSETKTKLNSEPASWFENFIAALTASGKGDLIQAEKLYRKAIELKPDYAEAHNNLANVLVQGGSPRIAEAETFYRKAIEIQPDYVMAYNNLSAILVDGGRLKEAEEISRKNVEMSPRNVFAFNGLGVILLKLGQIEEAISVLKKGVHLSPDEPNILLSLASAYKKNNDEKNSKNYAEKARRLSADKYLLACYYAVLEQTAESVKILGEVFETDKSFILSAIYDTEFDWIRDDPSFKDLLIRVNGKLICS